MTSSPRARIGIIGGSGFYSLLDDGEDVPIENEWGVPSAPLRLGTLSNVPVAFLPRHGVNHEIPPHLVNYRANIAAMRDVGVEAIIAPSVVGSLRPEMAPGDFVVADQLVDRTWGRPDTFFEGPNVVHASFADPYDEDLRRLLIVAATECGRTVHHHGTSVVIQGPRFSTRAESAWFQQMGWHVLSMTQHPEAVLARECDLPYAMLGLISDYDVGVAGGEPVTQLMAREVIRANIGHQRDVVAHAVELWRAEHPA